MERRRLLSALAGAAGVAFGGHAVAGRGGSDRPTGTATPTPSPTRTPTPSPPTVRPEGYGPLGRLGVPGTREVVVVDGRYAVAAVGDGFVTVDCGNPSAPALVAERRAIGADREGGPLEQVFDVAYDSDTGLLAAAGPAHPTDPFRGAAVFDVTDPTAPERVTFVETPWFNHNCFIDDARLYLGANDGEANPVVAYDARSGAELGRWSITDVEPGWADLPGGLWTLHDLWVADGTAYLAYWDAGTWLVDVSDPAAPELLGRAGGADPDALAELPQDEARRAAVQPSGNHHFVTVNEDATLLGVGVEAWDVGEPEADVGPGGIHLFDIADPAAPTELAVVEPPRTDDESFQGVWTTAHNFEFRDGLLVSSWYQGGVRLFDVTDPTAPTELAAWRNDARASFWTARHATDRFFVAGSRRDPRVDGRGDVSGAAVYTFPLDPDRAPATLSPAPAGSPTDAATATTPEPSTPTPVPADGSGSDTDGSRSDASGTGTEPTPTTVTPAPGFGVGSALAALAGLGAWRWRRRNDGADGGAG